MFVLPLLEVRGGESVHVLQAPSQGEARPLMDPVEVAQRFSRLGAQGLHVVDVDNAVTENRNNDRALLSIVESTALPIRSGGGVRSLKRIQELLDTGVKRVLVGTMGVLHPDWLKEAALIFGDRLVVCLDVRGTDLVVKGRTEPAPTPLDAMLGRIDALGVEALHVTYLGANGGGVDLAEDLARTLKTPVTYQGPVASPTDLERLKRVGVKGVVLGPEIYDGRLSFHDLAKTYRVQ